MSPGGITVTVEVEAAVPPPAPPGDLPVTGVEVPVLLATGLVLMLAATALRRAARRLRIQGEPS